MRGLPSITLGVVIDPAELDRLCPIPPDPDTMPRVVTRAQALARGYSRRAIAHRVERGSWRRVLPRVYLIGDVLTERDRWDAALAYAGDGAALSGAAALRASGVSGVAQPARVLVLVPPHNRSGSTGWVQVRRTHRSFVAQLELGPRRVEVARATADLALTLRRIDDVRALVARVVQRKHCTLPELAVELARGPRNGSALLRRALAEVGLGAASAPEAKAAKIMLRAGINGFTANATLHLPDGSFRVVDFYWKRLRACLEIDSVEWHSQPEDWSGTWDRHLDLSKFGYSVIHRPPSALADEAKFAQDVREWLAGREAELRRGLG